MLNMVDHSNDNGLDVDADNASLGHVVDVEGQVNSDANSYRSLGPGSSPLCRLLSERSTQNCVESGYVGSGGYVVPLHQTSIVPGHSIEGTGEVHSVT